MTKDEALKLALEALEVSTDWDVTATGKQLKSMQAITALRKALANVATNDTSKERVDEIQKQRHEANVQKFLGAPQPEQEPVALFCCGYADASAIKWNPHNQVVQCHNCGQIYTAPPQRTWVGLTDEDWDEIFGNALTIGETIKVTEAKLKQKNGYAEENT